jgi:hypothetical protein
MSRMLVYCDDPSHTAEPLGPIITDPDPALPDDVFIADDFEYFDFGGGWCSDSLKYRSDEKRFVHDGPDGGREIVIDDGTVLPQQNFQTKDQERLSSAGNTRGSWSPRCRWCGQRGGRWKDEDLDRMLTRLAEGGATGVSLRALDLYKHGAY